MGTYTVKVDGENLWAREYYSSFTVQSEAKEYSEGHPESLVQIYLGGIRFHQYRAGVEFWT